MVNTNKSILIDEDKLFFAITEEKLARDILILPISEN
jgi:hypothetical protein